MSFSPSTLLDFVIICGRGLDISKEFCKSILLISGGGAPQAAVNAVSTHTWQNIKSPSNPRRPGANPHQIPGAVRLRFDCSSIEFDSNSMELEPPRTHDWAGPGPGQAGPRPGQAWARPGRTRARRHVWEVGSLTKCFLRTVFVSKICFCFASADSNFKAFIYDLSPSDGLASIAT